MTPTTIGENELREPEVSVDALFANCDAWGAAEWFDRLVMAIQAQDRAVIAKDDVRFSIYRNIASTSAMRLARDYAEEIRTALAGRSAGLGTVSVKPLEWVRPAGAKASETMRKVETPVGTYRVWTHHEANGAWFWQLSDGPSKSNGSGTEQQCISDAEADFETRVKSCVTSIGVEAGWKGANYLAETRKLMAEAKDRVKPIVGGPEGETIMAYEIPTGLWLMLQAHVRNLIDTLPEASS